MRVEPLHNLTAQLGFKELKLKTKIEKELSMGKRLFEGNTFYCWI